MARINLCKKCGENIPTFVKNGDKIFYLQKRKYCLTCSPYNSRIGHKIYTQEASKVSKEKRLGKICECCKKINERKKGSKCRGCYTKIMRYKHKRKGVEYLGGKCLNCGIVGLPVIYHFHHLEPLEKSFNIGQHLNQKWEIIKKELDKCVLLCANCHETEHSDYLNEEFMKFVGV